MIDDAGAGKGSPQGSASQGWSPEGSAAGGHPVPADGWLYTKRFLRAASVALEMHAAQPRKGSAIPYASHLLGVCSIALDYGANEDQAIAALLHDAIEDVHFAPGAREAVAAFGPEVLRIVLGCTDADTVPKPPWRVRKEAYIKHLATADRAILLVSASDKLHNARSIVADLRRIGPAVFARFNPEADTMGYYRSLVAAFQANPASPADLIEELDRVVTDLEMLAAAAQDAAE